MQNGYQALSRPIGTGNVTLLRNWENWHRRCFEHLFISYNLYISLFISFFFLLSRLHQLISFFPNFSDFSAPPAEGLFDLFFVTKLKQRLLMLMSSGALNFFREI